MGARITFHCDNRNYADQIPTSIIVSKDAKYSVIYNKLEKKLGVQITLWWQIRERDIQSNDENTKYTYYYAESYRHSHIVRSHELYVTIGNDETRQMRESQYQMRQMQESQYFD